MGYHQVAVAMEANRTSREEKAKACEQITVVGGITNLFLVAAKAAAGYWGCSMAMVADAAHSFGDLVWLEGAVQYISLSLAGFALSTSHMGKKRRG